MFAEERHDSEFTEGQLGVLAADQYLMLVVINRQLAHCIGSLLGDLTVAGGGAGMADGCPHPRKQLIRAERLGQVIVSSQIQSGNLILLMRTGGDYDHRHGRPAADLTQDVQTVHIRQAQIQNHQIGAVRGDHRHGLGTAAGPHGVIAVGCENGGDEVGNAFLVLNDQNFLADIHMDSSLETGRQKINSAPSL